MKKILFLISSIVLSAACGDNGNTPDPNGGGNGTEPPVWQDAAQKSSDALIRYFWNTSGRYFNYGSAGDLNFHYWPQAHALDVLIDAYLRSGDESYKNYFSQWLEGVKVKNGNTYDNEYYDDMEWIALAILRAYKATGEQKYKDIALEIWGYIKFGWNSNAGGGIAWRKSSPFSKNACSNGPACILAARLYQEFGNEEDKEWALKIYDWERSVLFDQTTGAVWDNIDGQTGQIQKNWVFTYNQGTFIGSAIELNKIFDRRSYLDDAVLAADHTTGVLSTNSILNAGGTGDGGLFNGIFIRYFTDLILQEGLDDATKQKYIAYIKKNAETLWNRGTTQPLVLFSPDWRREPGPTTGLTEQLSGCMLIEAAALLDGKKLL
jgi:predicted alpha-1,6-mannanase (GH76 family)